MKRLSFLLAICFAGWVSSESKADQRLPQEPYVFCYTGETSVRQGEEVTLHLSSSGSTVHFTVHRLGGQNELVMQAVCPVAEHSIPDRASSDGCDWPVSTRFEVPMDWKSGYYEIRLRSDGEGQTAEAKSFFIVRQAKPGSHANILIQLSTNTYNAYTNWGGHSLYGYHDRDGLQGHRVSFGRPLTSQFHKWELPFVQWAERQGYELEYAANADLEFQPDILAGYRLVLSVGHDEYWSSPMRDALETFIADGGNVAFFSGNTCCWQVRSEDDGRALTCWKQNYSMDPFYRTEDSRLLSTAWSHHLVGRPENELTGVGFLWGGYHRSHGQFMDGAGAYTIHRPDHWVLAGTELERGEAFGGDHSIVGYECDGCEMRWEDGLPFPTGNDGTPPGFQIVATCPARWAPGDSYWYERFPKDRIGAAVLGLYTRGGTVFTCGSTDWAHGLQGNDPIVAQITHNVLNRLGKSE